MSHDQSVRDLVDSFIRDSSDEEWYKRLPAALKEWFANDMANHLQNQIETHLEFGRPVFRKYSNPDDTGWAGWYEVNRAEIGFLSLDKKFVQIGKEE